ncbi:MAG: SDR family oxidoreductase [Alphaproteobacteria bacterium]|nr:SDR family oxidoreductase [Alphaproteobacteria bacterium]
MQVSSSRALVTGGGSGLGRTFVRELAATGASVAFCDVDADAVRATVDLCEELPGKVAGFVANVADEAQVDGLVAQAAEALGGLDVLVNNAGIFRDALLVKRDKETGEVRTMTLQQWQQVIDVDLTGPFLCTRAFAAHCVRTGTRPAVVVNISSLARYGNRGQSNYSAAKAGLVADTVLWAEELAPHGLRVAAIAPGFVRTPILEGMPPKVLERMLATVPLGRAAEPEELWQAVRFLLECDYVTGTCIDVGGGLKM